MKVDDTLRDVLCDLLVEAPWSLPELRWSLEGAVADVPEAVVALYGLGLIEVFEVVGADVDEGERSGRRLTAEEVRQVAAEPFDGSELTRWWVVDTPLAAELLGLAPPQPHTPDDAPEVGDERWRRSAVAAAALALTIVARRVRRR